MLVDFQCFIDCEHGLFLSLLRGALFPHLATGVGSTQKARRCSSSTGESQGMAILAQSLIVSFRDSRHCRT